MWKRHSRLFNQCRSFLANISQNRQGFVDQEARKALKQFSDTLKFDKVAVTGANPATRMIMKIASSIMGISKITRFLKTDEEALAWLKE
jgi:alpha-L-fucosidase